MAFLEIRQLSKRFGNTEVLKDIDLSVAEGGFLVLVGPSGCGKTTLLNSIAGLETPSAGEVSIGGKTVNQLHPSERDIAMVFQSYALYPTMNVAQNMAFGLEMRGVSKAERRRAVEEVAELLQIDHLLKRKPGQLSGGQRQRVAMGRALVRKPQVFLFDEPLSNLDAKLRVTMRTEIKRLHQRLGVTIVYVTHDQVEAMTLATQIAVLKDGELQQVGTPSEVYANPSSVFVADFMGSPATNLLSATLKRDEAGFSCEVDDGERQLHFPLPEQRANGLDDYIGRAVVLGLRPEDISNGSASSDNAAAGVDHDCVIDVIEPTGSDIYLLTRLGGTEVTARLPAGDARAESLRAGDSLALRFNMAKVVLFDADGGRRIGA